MGRKRYLTPVRESQVLRTFLIGLGSFVRELDGLEDFEVVESTDASGFEKRKYLDLTPSLVIANADDNWKSQLATFSELRKNEQPVRVLVLSSRPSETQMLEALRVGALGYIPRSYSMDQLANAARTVARGNTAFNREFSGGLLKRLAQLVNEGTPLLEKNTAEGPASRKENRTAHETERSLQTSLRSDPADLLTPREIEVLRFVALGYRNEQIASELYISRGTVKSHVERVIRKLYAADRTGAVVRALELGILDLEDISWLRGSGERQ